MTTAVKSVQSNLLSALSVEGNHKWKRWVPSLIGLVFSSADSRLYHEISVLTGQNNCLLSDRLDVNGEPISNAHCMQYLVSKCNKVIACKDDRAPLAKALQDLAQKVAAVWKNRQEKSSKESQQESAHIAYDHISGLLQKALQDSTHPYVALLKEARHII